MGIGLFFYVQRVEDDWFWLYIIINKRIMKKPKLAYIQLKSRATTLFPRNQLFFNQVQFGEKRCYPRPFSPHESEFLHKSESKKSVVTLDFFLPIQKSAQGRTRFSWNRLFFHQVKFKKSVVTLDFFPYQKKIRQVPTKNPLLYSLV